MRFACLASFVALAAIGCGDGAVGKAPAGNGSPSSSSGSGSGSGSGTLSGSGSSADVTSSTSSSSATTGAGGSGSGVSGGSSTAAGTGPGTGTGVGTPGSGTTVTGGGPIVSSGSDAGVGGPTGSGGAGGSSGQGGGGGSSASSDAGAAAADAAVAPPNDAQPASDAPEPDANRCAALDPSKPIVLYQSADDSNSMASPAIARRLIRLGQRVPSWVIRPYEFMNYYRFGYEPAETGHVRVVPQMRAGQTEGEYAFQVAIQAEKAAKPRRGMNVTFVLDTSGSMSGSPMEIEIAAVKAMAAVLQEGDRVSMVNWNTGSHVMLDSHVVTGPNDPAVIAGANALNANGGTDLSGGLAAGYDIARRQYDKLRLNRVVLISDGVANAGVTDQNIIGQASHNQDQEGIYLVGVSVGDGINDTLMNVVTDKGRGAYVYLDSTDEAARMMNGRFNETMEVAARGVRLELTLPWYFAMKSFSGEMSSTNPNAVEPQHLSADDAMVFNETFVSCAPSSVNESDTIKVKATYQTPLALEDREDSTTVTIAELMAGRDTELRKGTAIFAYAEALRDADREPAKGRAKLDAALAKVQLANSSNSDAELIEIADLITAYRRLFP